MVCQTGAFRQPPEIPLALSLQAATWKSYVSKPYSERLCRAGLTAQSACVAAPPACSTARLGLGGFRRIAARGCLPAWLRRSKTAACCPIPPPNSGIVVRPAEKVDEKPILLLRLNGDRHFPASISHTGLTRQIENVSALRAAHSVLHIPTLPIRSKCSSTVGIPDCVSLERVAGVVVRQQTLEIK